MKKTSHRVIKQNLPAGPVRSLRVRAALAAHAAGSPRDRHRRATTAIAGPPSPPPGHHRHRRATTAALPQGGADFAPSLPSPARPPGGSTGPPPGSLCIGVALPPGSVCHQGPCATRIRVPPGSLCLGIALSCGPCAPGSLWCGLPLPLRDPTVAVPLLQCHPASGISQPLECHCPRVSVPQGPCPPGSLCPGLALPQVPVPCVSLCLGVTLP